MSARIQYVLILAVLYPLALLPLRALYVLSDFLYVLIYYVVRYRRGIVRRNLEASFPDKSETELRETERAFYRNFADYIVETVKLLHISDAEIRRRVTFGNIGAIENITSSGRSVAVYFSHCFNWEWAPSVTLHMPREGRVEFGQVYRPLRNRAFDSLMLRVRGRFGSLSLPKATALRELIRLRREGFITVTGFMSDQKPSHGDPAVITEFLNHPTAFISGTETLARKLGMGAVFWDMHRTGRGYYRIETHLLAENVADTPQQAVTCAYASLLEAGIRREPQLWLWTHNRWKNPVKLPTQA